MAPPSNIPWLQVWKCKRTISEALLMKRNDFVYVDDVQDHLDLIKPTLTQWAEDDYKELIKYITERRLLVNGQGLVIAELPKFGLDGKMDESVSPLFMWSLDILALDTYLKHYKVRTIPFQADSIPGRQKWQTACRQDVPVELSPNELKLTNDLENENNDKKALEAEVDDLENNKKGLENDVTKLKDELTAKTNEVDAAQRELDGMKKQLKEEEGKVGGDLEAKIVQLIAELAEVRRQIEELKQQLIQANNDKDALDQRIVGLQNQLDIMINNNKNKINKPEFEPSWMSNYWESDWVDFYGLKEKASYGRSKAGESRLLITRERTNYGEDNTTNVGRNFFNGAKYDVSGPEDFFFRIKVVDVARLSPNGYAKARFNPRIWGILNNEGTLYAVRDTHGAGRD